MSGDLKDAIADTNEPETPTATTYENIQNSKQSSETVPHCFYAYQLRKKQNREGIMPVISTDSYSPYGIACIQCNESLIAPEGSAHVNKRHVSHAWCCERCGHQFETSYYLGRSEPLFA